MQSFTQYTPTEIVFGRGAQKEAGKLTKKWGGSRVLLVYGGGSAVRSGLLQEIKEELDREGIACEELGDLASARTLLEEYLEEYPDDEAAAKEAEFLETR